MRQQVFVRTRWCLIAICTCLAVSCRKPPGVLDGVEIAGCAAFVAGPICLLPSPPSPPARLVVYVPHGPGDEVEAEAGGRAMSCETVASLRGIRCTAEAPPGAREVTVTLRGDRGAFRWMYLLGRDDAPPVLGEVAALRREGRLDEAAARMEAALPALPDEARGRAVGLLARIDLDRGLTDKALERLSEAASLNERAGRVSDAVSDAFARFFVLSEAHRFHEAREALGGLDGLLRRHDEGRARLAYYLGILAFRTGNIRAALRSLDEADDACDRLGLDRLRPMVRSSRALVLGELGRGMEALEMLRDLRLGGEAGPCVRGNLVATNAGWIALMEREAASDGASRDHPEIDPRPALEEAVHLLDSGCPVRDRANARLNLAFQALQRGDARDAARLVAEARTIFDDPGDAVAMSWRLDLDGRIMLLDQRFQEALQKFDELRKRAVATGSDDAAWRADMGTGQALLALGRSDGAIEAFARADGLLDRQSLLIPLDAGRGSFLGDRERSARALVGSLVKADRAREALRAARWARVRVLVGLAWADAIDRLNPEAQARWDDAIGRYRRERDTLERSIAESEKLPGDRLAAAREEQGILAARMKGAMDDAAAELPVFAPLPAGVPDPDPGVLEILYFPTRDGWLGFESTSRGVKVHPIGRLPPRGSPAPVVASALLGPFGESIRGARVVRFLPYGPLRWVDFHALPWEGGFLSDRVQVAYRLDLPARKGVSARTADPGGAPRALVVADTRNDLPGARRDADAVAGTLRRQGWAVEVLKGDDASVARVREALARAGVFHYSGHGEFAGRAGSDSALLLAGGGRLTAGDIISMPRVPGRVVLSGCETARGGDEGPTEGLGVAQAFVVAGAERVAASTRPLEDRLASALVSVLHGPEGIRGNDAGLPAEVRRTAEREAPGGDWAALRVLVR